MNIFQLPQAAYRNLESGRAAVIGGAVRSKIENTAPNDIDIYFFDRQTYMSTVNEMDGIIKYQDEDIIIHTALGMQCPIELIYEPAKRNIADCINLAEFNICTGCYTKGEFIFPNGIKEDINKKRMRFLKTRYPHISQLRLIKYLSYGYEIDRNSANKLFHILKSQTVH